MHDRALEVIQLRIVAFQQTLKFEVRFFPGEKQLFFKSSIEIVDYFVFLSKFKIIY